MSAAKRRIDPRLPWLVRRIKDGAGWRGVTIEDADGCGVANPVMRPQDDGEYEVSKLIVDAVNAKVGAA